jgi:hypothetical protein
MPRNAFSLLTFTLALIVGPVTVNATNLIVNGDFEAGNTGFSTDYGYCPPWNTLNGQYWIGNNPAAWHSLAVSYGDHTSGSGLMMTVNADEDEPDKLVWGQTVNVIPNSIYDLSMWVSTWSLADSGPLTSLHIYINSSELTGSPIQQPGTAGVWAQYSTIWNSGTRSTAEVTVIATITSSGDFALDDISMTLVPEPSTLALVTLCVVWRFRRRRW